MKNDMLTGKPVKTISSFALPIMFSSLLQFSYNFVDNIIVGRYVSTEALAAVGNIGSINSFIIGTALGLTSGFTIPVAQKFGAGDFKKMNKYAGNSISISFIIGLFFVAVAHIVSNPILRLINTPDNIIELSRAYINILYFGVPLQMLFNNFIGISRAVGNSKKPLMFLAVSVTVNFFLDILLVKTLHFGVEGAAAATVLSYLCATLFAGFYVLKIEKSVSISKRDLLPDFKTSIEQLKLGVPVSLQFTITSVGSMILQSAVNSFGSSATAALTAAGRVEQILNLPMSALGVANATFVAQNYGAGNYSRIIDAVKKILLLDACVCVCCSGVLALVGPYAVRLFMDSYDAQIMQYAKQYLYTIAACYIFVCLLFVFRNTLQGLGFTYANTIAGAGELIGRMVVSFLLTPAFGFKAVCFAGPFAWVLADIPLIVIYLKKKKQFSCIAQN